MIRRLILLQALAVLCLFAKAQDELTTEQLVKENMEMIRTDEPINEQWNMVCKGSIFNVFEKACFPYFFVTIPAVKRHALHYPAITSLGLSGKEDQRKSMDYLLKNCFDQNSGDVSMAFNYLKQYHIDSYNTKTTT